MTNIIPCLIASPLEQFEVTPLTGLYFFGHHFAISNLGLYRILTVFLVFLFHYFSNNVSLSSLYSSPIKGDVSSVGYSRTLVPSKWSLFTERSYRTLHSIVKEQIGSKGEIYLPLIYSLFFFILIANLMGNVPYSYALRTSAILSLGLSFTIFLGVTILALYRHRIHFFSFFVPAGTPGLLVPILILIELISYMRRRVSLGVRLFANLVAGHTLLKILSGMLYPIITSGIILFFVTLLPLAIFIALIGLEIGVSIIQRYVFTILVTTYLKDAIDLH